MPERPSPLPLLGSALIGAAAGLHAVSLWRTHGLLAGASPVLAAGLGLLGLAWMLARTPARAPGRSLGVGLGAALAAVLVVAGAVVAPLLLARFSPAVTPLLACLALALPALALRMLPERSLPAGLVGASVGTLGAALLLPFAGPFAVSLAAAALVGIGGLLSARGAQGTTSGASEATGDVRAPGLAVPVVLSFLAGIALAFVARAVIGAGSHPWTARPALVAFVALGLALGAWLGSRLHARGSARAAMIAAGLGLGLAALAALPRTLDLVNGLAASVATQPARPAVGVAGGLLTLLAGAALLGLPAGIGAGLSGLGFAPARRASIASGALAFTLGALALGLSGWGRFEVRAAEPPSSSRIGLADGHAVAWDAAHRRPEDLFAGHLAALASTGRSRAVLLGWESPETREVLGLHGFQRIDETGPRPRGWSGLRESEPGPKTGDAAGDAEAAPGTRESLPRTRGLADLARLGTFDVLVSHLEDPTLPEHEVFFTRQARETIRRGLLPGGVYVQRLSVARLGPEGLLRHVLLLRETFPDTWLATADLARGGSVLALCLGPAPNPGRPAPASPAPDTGFTEFAPQAPPVNSSASSAPKLDAPIMATAPSMPASRAEARAERLLPMAFLTAPERLPEGIQKSLRDARLLNLDDLLATFAAGPREIDALSEGLEPFDPWAPGSHAFRHPAPADIATDLTRGLLYGQLASVDLRFAASPRAVGGTHPQRWDLVGIDSRLSPEHVVSDAVLRMVNHLGSAFDRPAVSRASARRLVLEGPGETIEIRQRRSADGGQDALIAAMADLEGPDLVQSGGAVVFGHPGLWMLEQQGRQRQEITVAWHCPPRASLYTVELVKTAGVRPGLYQEPLRMLTEDLRCHAPLPSSRQAAGEPSATGAAPPPGGRP